MATTKVTYNKVVMENVVTREWDQEVVYDDSGTDMVYSRFRLRFEGIIHWGGSASSTQSAPAYVLPAGGFPGNAAGVHQIIRHLLSEPRKDLTVDFGADRVLDVIPAIAPGAGTGTDFFKDVENGPKPRGVRLTHITGDQVFRVEFAIEACKLECNHGATGVLSNRWGLSEAMDQNFYVTRTIRGRIKLSSPETPAHAYKGVVVPSLEDGFLRASLEYDVTPDGLTADYTVIDRQTHNAAPWPATKMTGAHTIATGDGVNITSEMVVRLEGPVAADKRLLIQRAVQICDARLEFFKNAPQVPPAPPGQAPGPPQGTVLIDQAAIIDHIGEENAVEVRLRIRHLDPNPRDMFLNLVENITGSPLKLNPLLGASGPGAQQYDQLRSIEPELHGYVPGGGVRDPKAVLFLLHCYLQDPCGGDHEIAKFPKPKAPTPKKAPPVNQSTQVSGKVVSQLPSAVDLWSGANKIRMYMSYIAQTKYIMQGTRVQLPIAQSRSAYQAGADTSVVIDLGLPTAVRQIRLEGERVGAWPTFPEPLDGYADGTLKGKLLEHRIEASPARLSADGRQTIFAASAYYVYALNRPPTMSEKVNVGVLPFTSLPQTLFDPSVAYHAGMSLGTALSTTGPTGT